MNRRGFLKMLGQGTAAVAAAPMLPAVAAAPATVAAAGGAIVTPLTAGGIAAVVSASLNWANTFGSPGFDPAIIEADLMEMDVTLIGDTDIKVGDIVDRKWFANKCAPNVDFVMQQMPDDMKLMVRRIEKVAEPGSLVCTHLELKEVR